MAKIERLHDSGIQGQSATRLAFAKTGSPLWLPTVSEIASGLRVSHWTIPATGEVSLASSQTFDHVVSQFDAVVIGGPVVVACRDAATKKLRLLCFNEDDVTSTTSGVIDNRRLAIVRRSFDPSWLVAYSDDDELRVQFWTLTGSGDNPVPGLVASSGDQAGAASHIAGAWSAGALVTAVRTGGSLKLIRWGIVANKVERLGDSGDQAGAVSEIAVTGFSSLDERARDFVITAVKNSTGDLELISWQAKSNGDVDRLHTATAGAVDEIAIATFDGITSENLGVVVTAVKNGSGNLELISWRVHGDGSIHRLASAAAGAAKHIAIGAVSPEIVATTCVDGDGREKVITWRITQDALFPP